MTTLWQKTLDSKYDCKCIESDSFYGKLTVTDIDTNNTLLDKELVLVEPLATSKWEEFCQEIINSQQII